MIKSHRARAYLQQQVIRKLNYWRLSAPRGPSHIVPRDLFQRSISKPISFHGLKSSSSFRAANVTACRSLTTRTEVSKGVYESGTENDDDDTVNSDFDDLEVTVTSSKRRHTISARKGNSGNAINEKDLDKVALNSNRACTKTVMASDDCDMVDDNDWEGDQGETSEQFVNSRKVYAMSDEGHELDEIEEENESLKLVDRDLDQVNNESVYLKNEHTKSAAFEEDNDLESEEGEDSISDDEDEDFDVGVIDNDENVHFRVGSLLDTKPSKVSHDLGDPDRPLWLRAEEAGPGSLKSVMKAWLDDVNPVNVAVITNSMTVLRRRKKFSRALELSDWVMTEKPYDLGEMDYGIRVELIAQVFGVQKAIEYFKTIPKRFQTAMVYSILLTMFVSRNMEKEAVKLVEKMEEMGMDKLTYMYNQLLFLYKKNGYMKGVGDVLQSMDEKEIIPNIYTYNIILDVRARKGNVEGMEKVWDQIKSDKSVKPDAATYAILAKGYCMTGMIEKAKEATKMAEGSCIRQRSFCIIMKLYSDIGDEKEVERVWRSLVQSRSNIRMLSYLAMIQAIGKVSGAERAEEIYKEMERKIGIKYIQQFNALFSVYSTRGQINKAEKLMKKIAKASLRPNPATYNYMVRLYLNAGDEEKAMATLRMAKRTARTSFRDRPMFASFQAVLDHVAEKGEVKKAEMIFKDIKDCGYACTFRAYASLLQAYRVSKTSPYGFLDRLKADNVFPNSEVRQTLRLLQGT